MLASLIPLYGDNINQQEASHEDLKGSGNLYGLPGGKLWGKKRLRIIG